MGDQQENDWTRFRIMGSSQEVAMKAYVRDYLFLHPECEVHVGCDSQNVRGITIYVTTIVFRFPGQGAHVIYRKERVEIIKDLWTKLWGETERSVDLANLLSTELHVNVSQIDLDYNTDPNYPSQKVYLAASGYVQSLGYVGKAKPNLLMAVWAANALCG